MISRPQNHGVVLVRVDDHAVFRIPRKGDRVRITVVQLLVVCIRMKFYFLDVIEKIVQEDVEKHRPEYSSLWYTSPNSLPARIRIANFYFLHSSKRRKEKTDGSGRILPVYRHGFTVCSAKFGRQLSSRYSRTV